ncbi:MAG: ATP-grasp fold amidoligase family protein [Bacilli bacterium]|jgi:hypothetical protein
MANPNFKENKIKRLMAKSLQPLLRVLNKKLYISWQYRYITGHRLNWKNPKRYTEKLQYLRLYVYPQDPLVIKCADRVGVRDYVKEVGLEETLIPIIGTYCKFDDIPWEKLPRAFAMKCSHACAFNLVTKDKEKVDYQRTRKQFNRYLKTDYGRKTVELHYSPIAPRILIEEHLLPNQTALPVEYKIHVFNGKARYLYVVSNRGVDIRYDNLFIDWTPFPEAQFNHWSSSEKLPQKPSNFAEMVKIAETLAAPFPFCRVDLYNIENKIYFSEMTFTPAKGTLIFDDDQADFIIGEWLDISKYLR